MNNEMIGLVAALINAVTIPASAILVAIINRRGSSRTQRMELVIQRSSSSPTTAPPEKEHAAKIAELRAELKVLTSTIRRRARIGMVVIGITSLLEVASLIVLVLVLPGTPSRVQVFMIAWNSSNLIFQVVLLLWLADLRHEYQE